MRKLLILTSLLLVIGQLYGQVDQAWGGLYPAVDERKIVESRWKYTYSIHLESNTIIHQADDAYDYFLYFRYDYTYRQFLNGEESRGTWSLNGSDLFYAFKNIQKFEIAQCNKKKLILEFQQPNAKGTYQYHFVRVKSSETPFVKPANELPDVIVERPDLRKRKRLLTRLKKRKKRRRRRRRSKEKLEPYISIELIGGGYYGGIDPVQRDYIHIKNSGRLIKEYKSQKKELQKTMIDIPREELEQFGEYVVSQKFFEMNRVYDCEDPICAKRKKTKPTPIPLRLAISYGKRRKVITITVYGKDHKQHQYVEYPEPLERIIQSIRRMAHRIE